MSGKLPTFDQLMNPLLRALNELGGSGSVDEIYDKVVELERVPEDMLSQPHDPEKSNQTEVAYRLAWARTCLKKYGLLENSTRGIWSLTPNAKGVDKLNPQDVAKAAKALGRKDGDNSDVESAVPPGGFSRSGVEARAAHDTDAEAHSGRIRKTGTTAAQTIRLYPRRSDRAKR
jgi:hypothetical protein